ncbi:MAG: glycosyltransferase family 39 protein [Planctomycetes bacterium]|nr:glycosyltransferase family 39 protein [Planctomycetota bacterium]MBI3833489.1 glycosyltransferase family 39 protein [Planctomycetota bacterium]
MSIHDLIIDATTELAPQPDDILPRMPISQWLTIFGAAFALYAVTANRGIQWQDAGLHVVRILEHTPENSLGLALSHPLHHWLGRISVALFGGIIEPCLAVTLISALAGAITIANVFGCSLWLTKSRAAALFAAGSLALAHTFWQFATLSETYTITTALLSSEVWCVIAYAQSNRARLLSFAFLFNGLGVANHMLGALTTPVLVVLSIQGVWTRKFRARHFIPQAAFWFIGASPYLWLIAAHWMRTGALDEAIHSALFGNAFADRALNTHLNGQSLGRVVAFIILNFPNLFLPFTIFGLMTMKKFRISRLARRALWVALVIHFLFAIRYTVIDEYTFLLPTYVLLGLFAAFGFAAAAGADGKHRRGLLMIARALLFMTPLFYFVAPSLARHFQVLGADARHKPYRDDYVYLFTPWTVVEHSADRLGRHATELAGERGVVVIEDLMAEPAVRYWAIRKGRKDLMITQDSPTCLVIELAHRGVPIVLVPARTNEPRTVAPIGHWRRDGDLYVLESAETGN